MGWDRTDAFDAYGDFDEDRVRVRAPRRGSRPRTKQRPSHEDAVPGFVTTVNRGRYTCLVGEGAPVIAGIPEGAAHSVVATTARELGKKSVVVGDTVWLVGDVTGGDGSLARIIRVEGRRTLLRRSADDSDTVERIIVANAEQLCVVVAAANPEPRPRLIDRYLVAAFDAGISPLLMITKTDLADPEAVRELVAPLDVPVFTSALGEPPHEEFLASLADRVTVMVGHSGVGKSTLVNAISPDAQRATGHVNEVTGRGRHTSSSSLALPVVPSGWIIDTPGVRSFGLGHVSPNAVFAPFGELAEIVAECPRGCTHLEDAPDCELDAAAERGELDALGRARVASLRRLIVSMSASEG
ncbi:ribosome small subunit-dependent GTPase A [Gulosibacter sediminis]|uniref:ribosome small subunit-dependent GTPase A n=1 Tax=Gulosibacter sediminis TaxID=1729695 RepID=UPI0024ADA80E|nr:ribosome small subunit-dependent GTPase A [Gulosibacter sediminis]